MFGSVNNTLLSIPMPFLGILKSMILENTACSAVDVLRRTKLKSGCLSLLTIHRFWRSRRVRAVVRVWLGFGLVWGCRLVLSILYQMPFNLLESAMWLCGCAFQKSNERLTKFVDIRCRSLCAVCGEGIAAHSNSFF